ncbi:hypothetical protein [Aurantimonas sp. HBX-1]|uniref:hypothetical protein n=1 Tax=Aurantimonas sp. HBX-1 TaxID=2906072 RepID=UPI001F344438|nr:hypothetical protein [Aurantimonas sp. HBX-1]UIJ70749.1 hypothetical protein LXB15_13470 [Aurantimonas sp. HBX-1]
MLERFRPQDRRLIMIVSVVFIGATVSRLFIEHQTYYELEKFNADKEWIDLTNIALARLDIPRNIYVNPKEPSADIDMFIFDSRTRNAFPKNIKEKNCSYVGDERTIVCDVELIRSLEAYFDFHQREVTVSNDDGIIVERNVVPENEEEIDSVRINLMTWILAHELGHLLQRHKGRFHFSAHNIDSDIDQQSYCHRLEYEADSYSVRLLSEKNMEDFYIFNYELLNRELRGLACPGLPKVALCENVRAGTGLAITDNEIENLLSGTHPQIIVRVLHIGKVAQGRQDFGLFGYQLDQVVNTQLKTIGSPSWRCR